MDSRTIRPARADEAPALSALAVRSKASWGYDNAFLEACRAELAVDAADCQGRLFVAVRGEQILGFVALSGHPPTGCLDALFVDPPAMGQGVGRALADHIVRHASSLGFGSLELDADPHARPFYEHLGFVHVRDVPSGSVAGRSLPRLRIDL